MNTNRTYPTQVMFLNRWPRLLLALLLLAMLVVPAGRAQAAAWCQCVDYVKNRYALSGAIGGNAKDMGPYLSARGFVSISTPKVGAVAVFKPAFGRGIDSVNGHVGMITNVQDLGSEWRITIRGANQGSTGVWTEYNCTNVKDWQLASYPKTYGSSYITYWTRNFALGRPTGATSIQGAGYEASKANDGNTGTRWSSRITGPTSEWWIVDLQSARTFDRVNIRWEAAYARRFFVGWSNDNATYTGYWYTATSAQNIPYIFGTRTARYVGIYMTEKAPGLGNYSIWEVGVFANASMATYSASELTGMRPAGEPARLTIR